MLNTPPTAPPSDAPLPPPVCRCGPNPPHLVSFLFFLLFAFGIVVDYSVLSDRINRLADETLNVANATERFGSALNSHLRYHSIHEAMMEPIRKEWCEKFDWNVYVNGGAYIDGKCRCNHKELKVCDAGRVCSCNGRLPRYNIEDVDTPIELVSWGRTLERQFLSLTHNMPVDTPTQSEAPTLDSLDSVPL